ncbi:hypothetical protein [Paenibacillus sp. USDA918EY]|uniref:hypothetical protein n=1 Tax=Paenibacillus sp. USDA918EY TaxID=2689575 RepID=UPI00135C3AEC|nr:hypothetical protein [Paenibacillus sp. USDA918EY]
MSWLKVVLKTNVGSGELEIEAPTIDHKQSIIDKFMVIFGASPALQPADENRTPPSDRKKDETHPPASQVAPAETAPERPTKAAEFVKPDLIGSTRTLHTPISEMVWPSSVNVEAENSEPDHFKTGVKYKEGVPHYRCRYWCKNPDCKNKGNQYIAENETSVECHNCGQKLKVRPAADGKLKRDGWGNFFIADEAVN